MRWKRLTFGNGEFGTIQRGEYWNTKAARGVVQFKTARGVPQSKKF